MGINPKTEAEKLRPLLMDMRKKMKEVTKDDEGFKGVLDSFDKTLENLKKDPKAQQQFIDKLLNKPAPNKQGPKPEKENIIPPSCSLNDIPSHYEGFLPSLRGTHVQQISF